MKLIIDVPEEVYEALKGIAEDATSLDPYSLADIIVNKSKPYEERPQGKWVIDENDIGFNFRKCSICNELAEWLDGGSQFLSNYCPNCGAEMEAGDRWKEEET